MNTRLYVLNVLLMIFMGCGNPASDASNSNDPSDTSINIPPLGDPLDGSSTELFSEGCSKLDCDDGNPCTSDLCKDDSCKYQILEGDSCDDGSLCTDGEMCDEFGACQGGEETVCEDGNPCTTDLCSADQGCVSTPLANTPCDDENPCTVEETCIDGACGGGNEMDCDDGNPCTEDACDETEGCVHIPNNNSCDDGDSCTLDDACTEGTCTGTILTCEDENECTLDGCDESGCLFDPKPNETPCSEGQCYSGVCVGGTTPPGIEVPNGSIRGFDVSDNGSITTAGVTGNVLWATCISPNGTTMESVDLADLTDYGLEPNIAEAASALPIPQVFVARADVSGHSVISTRLANAGASGGGWVSFQITPDCALVGVPDALKTMTNHKGYFDVTIGDNGTAITMALTGNSERSIKWLNGDTGDLMAIAENVGGDVNGNLGNHMAIHGATGNLVATMQGHQQDAVYFQRFGPDGIPLDGAPQVAGSSEGLNSWYDSHMVGMAEDGTFTIVYTRHVNKSLRAATYGPAGEFVSDIELAILQPNDESNIQAYDGFRYAHSKFEPLPSGTLYIHGQTSWGNGKSFVGTINGDGIFSMGAEFNGPAPRIRTDNAGQVYALDAQNGTITYQPSPYQLP